MKSCCRRPDFLKDMINFKDLANLEKLLLERKCFLCCLHYGTRMHLKNRLPQAKNFVVYNTWKEK